MLNLSPIYIHKYKNKLNKRSPKNSLLNYGFIQSVGAEIASAKGLLYTRFGIVGLKIIKLCY